MDIDDKNGQIDFDKHFPNEFSISFYKLKRYFNLKFSKLHDSDKSHPIQSADIYVIDKNSNEPVKYDLKNQEVWRYFILKMK